MSVEALLAQLDAQRDAYIDTFQRAHKALTESILAKADVARQAGEGPPSLEVPLASPQSPTLNIPIPNLPGTKAGVSRVPSQVNIRDFHGFGSTYDASTVTDDSDSSDDENERLYVSEHLPTSSFDHEHLRDHLKTYNFDVHSRQILAGIITEGGRLKNPSLFPASEAAAEEQKNYSHYQVFDVGSDGIPHAITSTNEADQDVPKALQVWHAIKEVNVGDIEEHAVGRITVAREPSAILFGALHLTYGKMFDMDELYRRLVASEASSVHLYRSFEHDERQRRSFVFNFEYFTIIGDGREPMAWQLADENQLATDTHLPISRCSSIIALSLHGDPIQRIRNSARRARKRDGGVYDPWQAWQVLNIQCHPDWKAKTDLYEGSKRYVNGPEAFLHTVLAEFKDAQKRFEEINKAISKLITPPADFIFKEDQRDKRLFEDKDFTYTRRYFWAHQTLGSINDSIQAIIEAYEDNFPDELWEGKHRTLWPLAEVDESGRNEYFRRRLRLLKMSFTREVNGLRTLIRENNDRRSEIRFLRDQLFSGTSVMESRKSVELSEITIQQGHNIRLLTIITIFFLPLSFVASVFGMSNMPTEHSYWEFALVLVTVCVPFFLLIGSLNTKTGYHWWGRKLKQVGSWVVRRKQGGEQKQSKSDEEKAAPRRLSGLLRSLSAQQGMEFRLGRSRKPSGANSNNGDFAVDITPPHHVSKRPAAHASALSSSGSSGDAAPGSRRQSAAAQGPRRPSEMRLGEVGQAVAGASSRRASRV